MKGFFPNALPFRASIFDRATHRWRRFGFDLDDYHLFEVFKEVPSMASILFLKQRRRFFAIRLRLRLVRHHGSYPFGMFAKESSLEFDLLMQVRY